MAMRNVEDHFGNIPTLSIGRSKLKRDCQYSTTANTGDLVPIYVDEVLPGDSIKIAESVVCRMLTPIAPVMDNAWLDTYFFFVPRRLVDEHWEELMGENKTDEWTQKVQYLVPQVTAPSGGWVKGTIAEKMGIPQGVDNISIDAGYFKAYAKIWNDWFRNENVSEPCDITTDQTTLTGSNGTDYVNDVQCGGMPCKAQKFADYFTRALPEAQKGDPVYLPLGTMAPVLSGGTRFGTDYNQGALLWADGSGNPIQILNGYKNYMSVYADPAVNGATAIDANATAAAGTEISIHPDNLYADLENATSATIGQLRQAFAVQRLLEIDARSGTRYIESIKAHFGVTSPDARHQRPEYLGGKRIPINMTDVVQNSSTDLVSPQGNVAGQSKTISSHDLFTWSATEHGFLIGLAVVRTEHSYQQGIPRIFSRKERLDFYYPELANISEQYIKNKEIYAQGTSKDEEAFGYQEAWAEYRYGLNKITGELNSNYTTPLDIWHYGDDYSQLPTLSHDWTSETTANVQRTLAIQSQDQFKLNFYFDQTWTRPMPIYSVPGLTGWM